MRDGWLPKVFSPTSILNHIKIHTFSRQISQPKPLAIQGCIFSDTFSVILSRLHRKFKDLEIRHGFTTFQLMSILEKPYHSLSIVENDPMLYEDFQADGRLCSAGIEAAAE